MKNLNLTGIKNIHFTGIGGISMSGLAEILHNEGYHITGSDIKASELTEHLQQIGIPVCIGQKYENVPENCQLLVYTTAVKNNNSELKAAKDRNIKIMERADMLGLIMKTYKYAVSVSGTHGKTTTTSMISEVFLSAGKDPTISVGGILNSVGSNFRMGKSDYFMVESCEYYDNFLKLYPFVGIILNIERDHPDFFKSMDQLESSFNQFAKNIHPSGCLVINREIANFEKIITGLDCNILTYGIEDSDFYALNIVYNKAGKPSFDIYHKGKFVIRAELNVTGEHNIKNALAVCAASKFLGLSYDEIKTGLFKFTGTKRRFEYKGQLNGAKIYDDYAHHPTEIKTTLSAAKKMAHNKLYCVFQPHTYSRTKALMDDFAAAFDYADTVIILDIYSARETDTLGVHASQLCEKIRERGVSAHYFSTFKEAEEFLVKISIPNDLLITLGAGDVYLIGENIL